MRTDTCDAALVEGGKERETQGMELGRLTDSVCGVRLRV